MRFGKAKSSGIERKNVEPVSRGISSTCALFGEWLLNCKWLNNSTLQAMNSWSVMITLAMSMMDISFK